MPGSPNSETRENGLVIVSVLAALLALWIIAGYLPTRNIETPEFKLLARTESYEIRLYAPRILAEVEVTGGYATESRVERETLELLEAARKDHLAPAGKALAAQYNPPWTPPFMRRNEVMVEVR
ncbi:MAG: heme-binding protein [Kiritimatiellia bacterium]